MTNPAPLTPQEQQEQREHDLITGGIASYRSRLNRLRSKGIETLSSPVDRLLKHFVLPVSAALAAWIDEAYAKPGRRTAAVPYLRNIDADIAALLTMRTLLDETTKTRRYQAVAHTIGGVIKDEQHFEAFAASNPALYGTVARNVEESPLSFRPGYRRRVVKHAANKFAIVWEDWPQTIVIQVGGALLDLAVQTTGLFRFERLRGTHVTDDKVVVLPTQELLSWLDQENSSIEALTPQRVPMTCPPKEHVGYRGGGFLTKAMQKPVVRTWQTNIRGNFSAEIAPIPFKAVNTLQAVPFEVNSFVLNVMKTMWENGRDIPGSARRGDIPLPSKPAADAPRDERRAYKAKAREVYFNNLGEGGKRLATAQTLALAEKYAGSPLWFAYFFDFRGRVYPDARYLSPQGSDLAKGLLKFHRTVIATPRGIRWLKIHTANSFGVDKVSLDDRVKWVEENINDINEVADDPHSSHFWHYADSPAQFLAACKELTDAVRAPAGTFRSSLPVMVDGSCNGIQHLAAMSRDAVAGARVNLVPTPVPADVYSDVKAAAQTLCEAAASGNDAGLARAWLEYGLSRRLAKRPTMIVPYGGTMSAFREYVGIELDDRENEGKPHPFGADRKAAVNFMAGILWEAVNLVLSGPRVFQKWTREASAAVSKTGNPLRWSSPSDFPVVQAYPAERVKRILTRVGGKSASLVMREPTDKLNSRRQSQSLAPNLTHSNDAAVLHIWTCRMADAGIVDVVTNHDCFGTHCEYVDIGGSINREVFVSVYKKEPLKAFISDIGQNSGAEIPPPPEPGTLDINLTLDSPYFCS